MKMLRSKRNEHEEFRKNLSRICIARSAEIVELLKRNLRTTPLGCGKSH